MKELVLTVTISNFTAQDYYKVVYAGPELFTRYHREQNNDTTASVTAWDGSKRDVNFSLKLNLPQVLKNMLGREVIEVVEHQEITWHSKEKFVVSSEPSLNFPGCNKFTTKGHTTVTTHGKSCQVDCRITCSAAMPWPMQSTVEAAMATEAQTSINKFLQYCKTQCEESTVKAPVTETVTVAVEAVSEGAVSEDTFFDALETYPWGEEVTQPLLPSQLAGQLQLQLPARGQPVAVAAGGHDMLLLASLRELQLSSHTTAQALADMATQMKLLNENVSAIRAAVTGPGGLSGSGYMWRSSYLSLTLLAAASAGTVWYLRSKQRSA